MTQIPLGRREGPQLEFKEQEALDHAESIGRQVVGMLNSAGGEVWVGIKEREGFAVAVDPISDPGRAGRALWDHLVDTLEPPPGGDEVSVQTVRDDAGRATLCVVVKKGTAPPYALLKKGGRYFYTRAGDRLRLMTRDEIFKAPVSPSEASAGSDSAVRQLREEMDRVQRQGQGLFWIGIMPPPGETLDVQDKGLWQYLQDAKRTGNRRAGWNFANPYVEPILRKDRLVHRAAFGATVEIRSHGGLVLALPLEGIEHRKGEKDISPHALIEWPVSLFRLASRLYADYRVAESSSVVADAALFGISEWTLRPYPPRGFPFEDPYQAPQRYEESKDLTWEKPLHFSRDTVVQEPDWCGFRLVRRVYEAFGYDEAVIPREFDRDTRRLHIPE